MYKSMKFMEMKLKYKVFFFLMCMHMNCFKSLLDVCFSCSYFAASTFFGGISCLRHKALKSIERKAATVAYNSVDPGKLRKEEEQNRSKTLCLH